MTEVVTVEKLTDAIRLVENLRSSIYIVFEEMVGGKTINDGIKDHRAMNDKEKGKKMVNNLHTNLGNVHKALTSLEHAMQSLGRYPFNTPLGNLGLLSLEPKSCLKPSTVYNTLYDSYTWANKMSENSDIMFKSLTKVTKMKNTIDTEAVVPRPFMALHIARSTLEDFIITMNTKFTREGLKLILMETKCGTMIKATINCILKACVVMEGLMVDRVVIHGFNESTTNDNIWPPSKFIVFKKLTEIANAASLYYCNPSRQRGVHMFFYWLSHYHNLYSVPCMSCGKILRDECNKERFLPPIRRDFLKQDRCFHPTCYQSSLDMS